VRHPCDPITFRLHQQRTEGYDRVDEYEFDPQSGTVCQDTTYAYDLAGNIISQTERAPGCGIDGVTCDKPIRCSGENWGICS
jgi:hypothetical protein